MDGNVFHSWSAQDLIDTVNVVSGQGSTFTDDQGRDYLDFSSQLVNLALGHGNQRLIQSIKNQADRLVTI